MHVSDCNGKLSKNQGHHFSVHSIGSKSSFYSDQWMSSQEASQPKDEVDKPD